jgi:hypothetical protein
MELKWNPPTSKNITATFGWGNEQVDYAVDVALGVTYLGGNRGPARDWTEVAIARNNLPQVFAANYNGNIREAFLDVVDHMKGDFSDVIDHYDWGIPSNNTKQYREGVPTWKTISDSGALRDSLQVEVSE